MNIFIQTLRTESLKNKEQRREREIEYRRTKDDQIREAMDSLEMSVMSEMEATMTNAASLGHFQAVLLTFNTTDVHNDIKTIFLMRGPLIRNKNSKPPSHNNNESYFVNKGIQPMLSRFQDKLAPMYVYIRYNKMDKRHELIASWKEYEVPYDPPQ